MTAAYVALGPVVLAVLVALALAARGAWRAGDRMLAVLIMCCVWAGVVSVIEALHG